jgi:hypothetical protein
MRLTGALSNQDGSFALSQLLDRKRQLASLNDAGARRHPPTRLRQGVIQSAVLDVLRARGALSVAQIHRFVEQQLGRTVSRDTVASFLSVACRVDLPVICRVERGVYELAARTTSWRT